MLFQARAVKQRMQCLWIWVRGSIILYPFWSWGWDCFVRLQIKAHKHAWVFLEPVDVEKLQIPDYYTVIKRPMDLGCENYVCVPSMYMYVHSRRMCVRCGVATTSMLWCENGWSAVYFWSCTPPRARCKLLDSLTVGVGMVPTHHRPFFLSRHSRMLFRRDIMSMLLRILEDIFAISDHEWWPGHLLRHQQMMTVIFVDLHSTVKTRMEAGQILSPEQFKDDVLLTFRNAMKWVFFFPARRQHKNHIPEHRGSIACCMDNFITLHSTWIDCMDTWDETIYEREELLVTQAFSQLQPSSAWCAYHGKNHARAFCC